MLSGMAIQEEKVPTYHFGLPPTAVFFQLRGKKDIESTAEANRDSGGMRAAEAEADVWESSDGQSADGGRRVRRSDKKSLPPSAAFSTLGDSSPVVPPPPPPVNAALLRLVLLLLMPPTALRRSVRPPRLTPEMRLGRGEEGPRRRRRSPFLFLFPFSPPPPPPQK